MNEITKVDVTNKAICKHYSTEINDKMARILTCVNKCTKTIKISKSLSLKLTGTGSQQSDNNSLMPSTQSNVSTSQMVIYSTSAGIDVSFRTVQQKGSSKVFVGVQKLQRKVSDFAIIMTASQTKALDKAVARFFFFFFLCASNVSILTAGGKHFKELMNNTQLGYLPQQGRI